MQWYSIVAVIYAVGGILGYVATYRLVDYCRPRSVLDREDTALLHALEIVDSGSTSFLARLRDVLVWPLSLAGWVFIAFVVWRRRRSTNRMLNETLAGAHGSSIFDGDGFDTMRDAHDPLAGPGVTAFSVAVTVDGRTSFAHWLSKGKLDELWVDKGEIGAFLRSIADGIHKEEEAPRLSLIKNTQQKIALERALNLAGLCFYGKRIDDDLATSMPVIAPVFVRFPKITDDYMFLPLFEDKHDGAKRLSRLGMDVKVHNLEACRITDASHFLMSCPSQVFNAARMRHVPVRVITNLVERDGDWTFDTICEISQVRAATESVTSRDEGPASRPPAA